MATRSASCWKSCGFPMTCTPSTSARASSSPRLSSKSPPTTACPPSSTPMGRAAGRSRSSNRAPSSNIWAANHGRFYPQGERERVQVEEWLFWQVGGLGPMAGQSQPFPQLCPGGSALSPRSAIPMRCTGCSG